MCQISGIINDCFNLQTSYGYEPVGADIDEIYKQYHNNVSINPKEKIRKIDKNKLLYLLSITDSGYLYWNSCVKYIFDIVLSRDDKYNSGNQPNRNKICHGIQTDFDTREHALKSILIIDMLLELFEATAIINKPSEKGE